MKKKRKPVYEMLQDVYAKDLLDVKSYFILAIAGERYTSCTDDGYFGITPDPKIDVIAGNPDQIVMRLLEAKEGFEKYGLSYRFKKNPYDGKGNWKDIVLNLYRVSESKDEHK